MEVGIVGKESRSKTFLMLYLGKVLSQAMAVTVVTKDQWFIEQLEDYEYSHGLNILAAVPKAVAEEDGVYDLALDKVGDDSQNDGMVLVDIGKAGDGRTCDKVLFLTEPDCVSVNQNLSLFKSYKKNEDPGTYVFMNLLMDSKINEKYLCNRLGINRKQDLILPLYLDDQDMAVHLENGYNNRLDMSGLSKAYKHVLLSLALTLTDSDKKTPRRWLKSAERSK